MASMTATHSPSPEFRKELRERGGASASRCMQCATCTAVCELATSDHAFPRRQILWAQWGMKDRLAQDPSLWLCHQCNDCSTRCPRDARPGDVMQVARALMIEEMAVPRFMGKLVGRAAWTWWLLLGLPMALWGAILWATTGLHVPERLTGFGEVVSHATIYAVMFPITALVLLVSIVSARRYWQAWGMSASRSGSFLGNLLPVLVEIATHRRFGSCAASRPRRAGHFALLWGFAGAALTTFLTVVAMYGFGVELPVAQAHPFKLLGNFSAALLAFGGGYLLVNRLVGAKRAGHSTAFDNFFLAVVLVLVATGVLSELGRLFFAPGIAVAIYVAHLGSVVTLFITFPYSKFAHLLYRTLAMTHERMVAAGQTEQAREKSPVAAQSAA